MKNYTNPIRIRNIEDTLNELKKLGVTEVYIQVLDGNNVEFVDKKNQRNYRICYSNEIYEMSKR